MDVSRLYRESPREAWWVRFMLPVLATLWLGELAAPISQLLHAAGGSLRIAPALAGAAGFVVVYLWVLVDATRVRSGLSQPASPHWSWPPVAIMAALAILVSSFYGPAWLGLFIFAGVGSALRLPTTHAAWTIVGLTLVAGAIGLAEHDSVSELAQGGLLIAGIGASVATVGYTIRTTRELRAARAEVARLAVSEERLRFARDLHDLLGHSLSLVALKCDLAEQLVANAPERARQEIQEAAGVTREALREVREAVAGYRQPTLAGELAAAQEMLAAAGIGWRLTGQRPELPAGIESPLSWTLREAITNVIRHSRAQRCTVRFGETGDRVEVEVTDDGVGQPANGKAGGSGLGGIGERLAAVDGLCEAGPLAGGGFRVFASVPLNGARPSGKEASPLAMRSA